jgi:hypothetical protein
MSLVLQINLRIDPNQYSAVSLSRVNLAACSVAEGVLPMGATNFTHFQPGQVPVQPAWPWS